MKSKTNTSTITFSHIISIALGFAAVIVTIVFTFIMILLIEYSQLSDMGLIIVESVVIIFFTSVPCYFISKKNPNSFWYIPIITNLGVYKITIVGAHSLPILSNFWTQEAKIILLIITIILAFILSALGAKKVKFNFKNTEERPV